MTPGSPSRRIFLGQAGLAAAALLSNRLSGQATNVVKTRAGALGGLSEDGVRIFRGVPFARPPVGSFRFRAPEAVAPWSGVRDATSFSAAPMQPDASNVAQSEDCLYLNVWAPTPKGPHPVFVWIHGGGFTGGHAFEPIYDGAQFAREGIVVVTVAYRLGAFGFLDLEPALGPSYAGSANNALGDLIAALEWIKANIADFGGDPSRVTIGGESAGAKLSDLLMGVPAAGKLFQQAISESGGAERVWPHAEALRVGLGFDKAWQTAHRGDVPDLLHANPQQLIAVQKDFMDVWPQHFPLRPEVDGRLIATPPVAVIAAGATKGKRLLIGTNRDESALFIGPHPSHDATARDVGNINLEVFQSIYAKYRGVYPAMNDVERRIRALTAEEYWIPTIRVADAHIKGGGSAWVYQLQFAESSGRLSGYAYHSLDVGLVWDKPHTNIANSREESALAAQIHAAWAAFMRGQSPSAPGLPGWPPYSAAERPTMVLNTQSRVETRPQEAELRLWDGAL